jgi:hypothetical protein
MSYPDADQVRAWAQQEAGRTGFASVEAYLESLVIREQQSGDWIDQFIDEQGPPPDDASRAAARQRIVDRAVGLLNEAVNSGPPQPMKANDWEDLRRQLLERQQARLTP